MVVEENEIEESISGISREKASRTSEVIVQNLPSVIKLSKARECSYRLGITQSRLLDYHALKRARVYNIIKSTIFRLEWPTYLTSQAMLLYDRLAKTTNRANHAANDRIMAFLAIYHAAKAQGIIINVARLLEDGGLSAAKFRRAMLKFSPAKYAKDVGLSVVRTSFEKALISNALLIAKEFTGDASLEHVVAQVYSRLKRELVSFKERTVVGIIAYLSVLRVSETSANLNQIAARVGYPLSTLYSSIVRLYKKITRDPTDREEPGTSKLFKKVKEMKWVFPEKP